MTERIYLDHAAATPIHPQALKIMHEYLTTRFGNPHALHKEGIETREALDGARERIAEALNASPTEIVFTGGGTESINLAIQGAARACRGRHIITSKAEHSAVLETCRYLERKKGFSVTYLPVDKEGRVSPAAVKEALRDDTVLVSIMQVNNVVGTINPVKEIAAVCRERGVLFHTDACQAIYERIDTRELGVDLLTLNGSKLGGVNGVGLLFVRQGVGIVPLVFGGGQESGLRSGTENVPGIIGFAQCMRLDHEAEAQRLAVLREMLWNGLAERIPGIKRNTPMTGIASHILNVTFPGIENASLVLELDESGLAASAGSACSAHRLEANPVLLAMGYSRTHAHGSVRFSLGRTTTKEDIAHAIDIIVNVASKRTFLNPQGVGKTNT